MLAATLGLSDDCACLSAALPSARTYSSTQLGSYHTPVLRHTLCMYCVDAVSSCLPVSCHQQDAIQGGLTSCSQPYAMQEWLTLFTKDVFGKAGGVFQPCPGDPATVHPIRAQERGEKDWPYWPEGLVRAGKLAGLFHTTLSTALPLIACTCCTEPM